MTPPIAHNSDPITSHLAAQSIEDSGTRQRHQEMVYRLVESWPDCTAVELWERAEDWQRKELKEPQEIRRRLTDLLNVCRVVQGQSRKCTVRGTTMVVWRKKAKDQLFD